MSVTNRVMGHNPVRNGNHTTVRLSSVSAERGFAEIQQNAEYRYGMPHPCARLGSGLWVGLGLGLQLELLMAFVVWCEKSSAKKVLVSVQAILFSSSIGTGIGNTFCQSIGTGNTFHKYQ